MSEQTKSDAARTVKDYSERLALSDHVLEPTHREIVAWLELALGLRVLDAGCGRAA
jgi:hypothetical protein